MRAAILAALILAACGAYEVRTMREPERPPMSLEQCRQLVRAYCRDCHESGCSGWTVYETICGMGDCLHALELCPAQWPDECGRALDPASLNDCDT